MNNGTMKELSKAIVKIDKTDDDPLYKCLMAISASLVGVVHELGTIRRIMEDRARKDERELR